MHIIFDDFVWQNNMHVLYTIHELIFTNTRPHEHTHTLKIRAIKYKADSLLPSAQIHMILCGFITLRFYMRNAMNKSVAWMISSEMIKSFDTVISSLRTRAPFHCSRNLSFSHSVSVPLFLSRCFSHGNRYTHKTRCECIKLAVHSHSVIAFISLFSSMTLLCKPNIDFMLAGVLTVMAADFC